MVVPKNLIHFLIILFKNLICYKIKRVEKEVKEVGWWITGFLERIIRLSGDDGVRWLKGLLTQGSVVSSPFPSHRSRNSSFLRGGDTVKSALLSLLISIQGPFPTFFHAKLLHPISCLSMFYAKDNKHCSWLCVNEY